MVIETSSQERLGTVVAHSVSDASRNSVLSQVAPEQEILSALAKNHVEQAILELSSMLNELVLIPIRAAASMHSDTTFVMIPHRQSMMYHTTSIAPVQRSLVPTMSVQRTGVLVLVSALAHDPLVADVFSLVEPPETGAASPTVDQEKFEKQFRVVGRDHLRGLAADGTFASRQETGATKGVSAGRHHLRVGHGGFANRTGQVCKKLVGDGHAKPL
jgi:hypothetical protein